MPLIVHTGANVMAMDPVSICWKMYVGHKV